MDLFHLVFRKGKKIKEVQFLFEYVGSSLARDQIRFGQNPNFSLPTGKKHKKGQTNWHRNRKYKGGHGYRNKSY
jgi:hypothetical protein